MYRGPLGALADGDGDGQPDEGYGHCLGATDGSTTRLVNEELPPVGGGFFYLKLVIDAGGVERGLGADSAGRRRQWESACP